MTTTTSRRAILAGAAMLPAVSLPALAIPALASAESDPAFAAVEQFKKAWIAHGKSCQSEPTLPDGCPEFGTPNYIAWCEANDAACNDDADAFEKMLATRPTTNAGAAAIVRAYSDTHGELDNEWCQALLEKLHESLTSREGSRA